MSTVILSSAYLPNLSWYHYFIKSEQICIEKHEHYIKQSFRNRCEILSANGKLSLIIPLEKNADKELITEKKISYKENWQVKHWRAITSAYKNSPYFEYFEDEFKPFYTDRHEFLFDYNLALLQTINKILRIKKDFQFTEIYDKLPAGLDLRNSIHPKKETLVILKPYHQVFSDKHGFNPDLSIIDLLFNKGLETPLFLSE